MKLYWWLWAVTFVVCSVAFAQDHTVPALPTDAQAFDLFGSLWQFFVTKNYAAAAGPGLTLAVWALKKWDLPLFTALRLPKVGAAVDEFLDKPFVSFLLPTVAAGLAGGITALVTGHSFVDALNAIWSTSSTAIATYVGLKKAGEQHTAGVEAAKEVADKPTSIVALKAAAAEEAAKEEDTKP